LNLGFIFPLLLFPFGFYVFGCTLTTVAWNLGRLEEVEALGFFGLWSFLAFSQKSKKFIKL
jgi:hypothetical protein